jgi:hypothetical protein
MFTRTFSVGKTRVLGRAVSMVLALGFVLGALSLAGCPMEDDDSSSKTGLDSKLVGTWEFDDVGYGGDRYIIKSNTLSYGYLNGTGAEATFAENFEGKIAHAESYSKSAGIIIIEFTADHEYVWMDNDSWHEDPSGSGTWVADPISPQPSGKFYGIYYHHLTDGNSSLETVFANTTDQKANYGPTVTETLQEAIEKFTVENMNQLMDIEQGHPMHKVE